MSSLHVQARRAFKPHLNHLLHVPFTVDALHNVLSNPSGTNLYPLLHPQCRVPKPPQLRLWDSPPCNFRVAAPPWPATTKFLFILLPFPWKEDRTHLLDKIFPTRPPDCNIWITFLH
uniref:Uncharacterized protein n=1 Tax=Arundo donax TaxID=35708 RepID=A0A0A9DLA1_ARUDO